MKTLDDDGALALLAGFAKQHFFVVPDCTLPYGARRREKGTPKQAMEWLRIGTRDWEVVRCKVCGGKRCNVAQCTLTNVVRVVHDTPFRRADEPVNAAGSTLRASTLPG